MDRRVVGPYPKLSPSYQHINRLFRYFHTTRIIKQNEVNINEIEKLRDRTATSQRRQAQIAIPELGIASIQAAF